MFAEGQSKKKPYEGLANALEHKQTDAEVFCSLDKFSDGTEAQNECLLRGEKGKSVA